ncbi:hypothetical protein K470DRAFT_268787 [Piedraia hortae CBS 480.64]|uniref:Uncharacterized protein n=1 Tax=Piedraia hortae CBS 480.64 TaxID=1314780 RepID=A0A6A7C703_9PEZI|nr:hypothetical protein K470DRAFT_268787 [Piedraia hortae CBS 480.64]
MSQLTFPENGRALMKKCSDYNIDLGKWLVYAAPTLSDDQINKFCYAAMKAYTDEYLNEPESEWEAQGFLKPADERATGLQDALDKHFKLVQKLIDESGDDSNLWNDTRIFPFGLIFLKDEHWERDGVQVAHCDHDEEREGEDEVKLDSAKFMVDRLGFVLTTVASLDDSFENCKDDDGI